MAAGKREPPDADERARLITSVILPGEEVRFSEIYRRVTADPEYYGESDYSVRRWVETLAKKTDFVVKVGRGTYKLGPRRYVLSTANKAASRRRAANRVLAPPEPEPPPFDATERAPFEGEDGGVDLEVLSRMEIRWLHHVIQGEACDTCGGVKIGNPTVQAIKALDKAAERLHALAGSGSDKARERLRAMTRELEILRRQLGQLPDEVKDQYGITV